MIYFFFKSYFLSSVEIELKKFFSVRNNRHLALIWTEKFIPTTQHLHVIPEKTKTDILGCTSILECRPCICFLKHPFKQCRSPLDISSMSLQNCYIFLMIQCHYFFNPAIFLAIFNFTLIVYHNVMAFNLELHTIAIKCCFGVQQPHMWYFL